VTRIAKILVMLLQAMAFVVVLPGCLRIKVEDQKARLSPKEKINAVRIVAVPAPGAVAKAADVRFNIENCAGDDCSVDLVVDKEVCELHHSGEPCGVCERYDIRSFRCAFEKATTIGFRVTAWDYDEDKVYRRHETSDTREIGTFTLK